MIGATGLIGGHVVKTLLSQGSDVAAFSRREFKPDRDQEGRLQVHRVDFERLCGGAASPSEQIQGCLTQVQRVYCCLGTTMRHAGSKQRFRRVDVDYVLAVARLAQQSGVQQFHLVSAVGAHAKSPLFYCRIKAEVEQRLRSLKLPSLVIYRPSLLLGERDEHRVSEALGAGVARVIGWSMRGPLRRYRAISAETVARAMCNVAHAPRDNRRLMVLESEQIARLGK